VSAVHFREAPAIRPRRENPSPFPVEQVGSTSVPGHDEHRPCRPPEYAFGHRRLSESPPTPPPIRAQNHEVHFPGVGVEHDHARWIAVF
jgi:hypothetical protein